MDLQLVGHKKGSATEGAVEATGSAKKSISRKVAKLKSQDFQEHHIR